MDKSETLLALIAFLLAALVYETGDGTTPAFIVIPSFLILFGIPVYTFEAILIENVINK
ncbi:hypothetical protein ACNS7O_15575 (plasmid) [Haloferacaceae archaeon DSL9]